MVPCSSGTLAGPGPLVADKLILRVVALGKPCGCTLVQSMAVVYASRRQSTGPPCTWSSAPGVLTTWNSELASASASSSHGEAGVPCSPNNLIRTGTGISFLSRLTNLRSSEICSSSWATRAASSDSPIASNLWRTLLGAGGAGGIGLACASVVSGTSKPSSSPSEARAVETGAGKVAAASTALLTASACCCGVWLPAAVSLAGCASQPV